MTNAPNLFAGLAGLPGVQVLTGDFNGDGRTDIAITAVPGRETILVAFSNGDGIFNVTNAFVPGFASWAAQPGVRALSGDFNGDGRADIALVGGAGWASIPVAFSNGDGTFSGTNAPVSDFAGFAATPGVRALTGDFNGDGRADIALVGGAGWASIPVAFSNGDGTFKPTNAPVSDFPGWAAQPGVTALIAARWPHVTVTPPVMTTVPQVLTNPPMELARAVQLINDAKLGVILDPPLGGGPTPDLVISANPPPGSVIAVGKSVTLGIRAGQPQ